MTKNALLDAAEAVLADQGTQALTLNAVAERAGVSKGGLLYHYGSKEALIKALVHRVIEDHDALIAAHDDGREGGYTRAFVHATFEILSGESRVYRRWSAIMAAATDPGLAAPLNEAMHHWHRAGERDGPDPLGAAVVKLAAEGLWEVVSHAPDLYDEAQLRALRDRMLALLDV